MPKTKKNYKKRRTIRTRKSLRGAGFTESLRVKTRRAPREKEIKRTINLNSFNRLSRNYFPSIEDSKFIATAPKQTIDSPSKFKDNGYMVDNTYGPNKSAFYSGPSVISGEKGIPHGKEGIVVYPTGHIYKGDFNKGKREGTGTFTVKDGPTYEGEWNDDKFVPFTEWKSQNKIKKNKKIKNKTKKDSILDTSFI